MRSTAVSTLGKSIAISSAKQSLDIELPLTIGSAPRLVKAGDPVLSSTWLPCRTHDRQSRAKGMPALRRDDDRQGNAKRPAGSRQPETSHAAAPGMGMSRLRQL